MEKITLEVSLKRDDHTLPEIDALLRQAVSTFENTRQITRTLYDPTTLEPVGEYKIDGSFE